MKAVLAAALAGAAFAAPPPPPPAYQTSTTAATTTSESTTLSTPVVSPTPTGGSGSSWPSCWSSCFQQYGVSSESGLCSAPLNSQVSSCIESACPASDAQQYEGWVESYCGAVTVTDTETQYTTICPVTETQTSGQWTGTTVYVTTSTVTASVTTPAWPTWTSPAPTSPPEAYSTVTVTWGGVWTSTQTVQTGVWTTITDTDTQYTTICPVTETWVSSGTTSVISYISTVTPPVTTPSGYGGNGGGSGNGNSGTGATSTQCSKKAEPTEKCVPCQGQPGNDPDTWCGLDINTNYWNEVPITCRTVEYDFTITQGTASPDGIERPALLVNNQMPGPAITANWGDTVIVHVHNQLPTDSGNGTTLHWHGIRQNRTTGEDGVPSITQCPITPGDSQTYTWVATSYGTSWYHSHWSLQTWEGVFGPITINGPASAEYDDEASVILQDWSHSTADELYNEAQLVSLNTNRSNPVMDLGLINGVGLWQPEGDPVASGSRWQLNVTAGKRYRLRLVNAAIAAVFVFYVDQHELTVIAADFAPVEPFTVQILPINIGQRYDVILEANQPVANYWMRSDNQQPCSPMITYNNTLAIVSYEGAPAGDPTSQAYGYEPTCEDLEYGLLKPIWSQTVGSSGQTIDEDVVIGVDPSNTNLYKWTLSGTSFTSQWGNPTLQSILVNGTIPDYSGNLAISAPNLGEWVYVIIDSPIPVAHPIHLHGHEFLILAQGQGLYNSSIPLNLVNPPRRDVAQMNADPLQGEGSYLVVAFWTDNPGVWLMHCHVGWHQSMGFALQIIEAQDQIAETVTDSCAVEDQCKTWNAYAVANNIVVPDSGI